MNLYELGVLILISVLTCLAVHLDNKRLRKYIKESHGETITYITDTVTDIEKSGEETRSSMQKLSQMIMRSCRATRGELKEMLETLK